jgi:hypothetical protein
MMRYSVVVLYLLHTATLFQGHGGVADAFHVPPPHSFYPPPGFEGRGRRYEGGDNEDYDNDHEDDGWFYAPHYPDHDPYFRYDGGLPPPPFPPPPPHPHYRHPRFMEPPPPHVIMYETPEIPQSQVLTTTREDDSSFSPLEHQPSTGQKQQSTRPAVAPVQSIWKTSAPVLIQSSALQTFAFDTPSVERVQVLLKTGHRHGRSRSNPLQASIDVWHGPDSTPQNLAIYLEDDEDDEEDDDLVFGGRDGEDEDDDTTNFSAIIETPQGYNTIAVRNTAPNFDLLACVEGEECPTLENENGVPHHHMGGDPSGYYYEETYGIPRPAAQNQARPSSRTSRRKIEEAATTNSSPLQSVIERLMATSTPHLLEGTQSAPSASSVGMETPVRPDVHTVRLAQNVASVQVLLRTDYMRPLQARVELILKESSSRNKKDAGRVLKRTIVEVFSEDGMHRPFFAVLETPKKRKRKRNTQDDSDKKYSVSLRVINLSGSEFPIFASIEPYIIDTNNGESSTGRKGQGERSDSGGNCWKEPEDVQNSADIISDDDDILEEDWWEQSMENSHFGGGSHYDMSTNSTILDAEIL